MTLALKDVQWPTDATHVVRSINSNLPCLNFFKDQNEFDKWVINMENRYPMFSRVREYPIKDTEVVLGVWIKDKQEESPYKLIDIYKYPLDIPKLY